jgi:HEAT repeat protein
MRSFEELMAALKTRDAYRPSAKKLQYSNVSSSATYTRAQAAHELGQLGRAEAVEPLMAALKDWSSDVKTAAAGALVDIGDERAAPAIAEALQREEGDQESKALRSCLMRLGHPDFISVMMASLKDSWCCASAVAGLTRMLERHPERMDTSDLEAILALKEVVQIQGAWDYREMDMAERVAIDTTALKESADRELKHGTGRIVVTTGRGSVTFEAHSEDTGTYGKALPPTC